jgi:hypothetical protein
VVTGIAGMMAGYLLISDQSREQKNYLAVHCRIYFVRFGKHLGLVFSVE